MTQFTPLDSSRAPADRHSALRQTPDYALARRPRPFRPLRRQLRRRNADPRAGRAERSLRALPATIPEFLDEFRYELKHFVGRPSRRSTTPSAGPSRCGGAQIYFKREDLNHTGAHKINNVIGQALLAKRMGKPRVIAETGAGQHGVATATICARFGLECVVYMGSEDVKRQAQNVYRMKLLGATVVPVESGSKTLKDALNEAMRDWVTNVENTFYIIGTVAGPHPVSDDGARFPVGDRRGMPGADAGNDRAPARLRGGLHRRRLECDGHFLSVHRRSTDVQLVGVEAAGEGLETRQACGLADWPASPGVLHGNRTYLLQDENGQIIETHSVSAGLDYPGVGPEHAWLKDSGRAAVRVDHRRRGAGRVPRLLPHRRHHPGAGIERTRWRMRPSWRRRCPRTRSSWSTCPAAATRTCTRWPQRAGRAA